jgi:hypothetical protein
MKKVTSRRATPGLMPWPYVAKVDQRDNPTQPLLKSPLPPFAKGGKSITHSASPAPLPDSPAAPVPRGWRYFKTTNITRRFLMRPSRVLLSAMGRVSP